MDGQSTPTMPTMSGKSSRTGIIIAIVVILILAAVAWAYTANDTQPVSDSAMNQDTMMVGDDSMIPDDSMVGGDAMVGDDKMMQEDDAVMQDDAMMEGEGAMGDEQTFAPSVYKSYSAAAVADAQMQGQKVVLFFHANWCPFCKTADQQFISRLSDIPAGVTVLKTDYDTETALKQKYGITYQHTFVQIDNQGNQVSKWSGGDIDNLKKYLKI